MLYAGTGAQRPQQAVRVATTDGDFDTLLEQYGLLDTVSTRPAFPDQVGAFIDLVPDLDACPLSAHLLGVWTPGGTADKADVVIEVSAIAYGVRGCTRDATEPAILVAAVPAHSAYDVAFVTYTSGAAPDSVIQQDGCGPADPVWVFDCLVPPGVRDFQWYDDHGDYP